MERNENEEQHIKLLFKGKMNNGHFMALLNKENKINETYNEF